MNTKFIIIIAVVLSVLAACSTVRWNPAEHHVSVEGVAPDHIEISQIYMRQAEKGIAIHGEVSPRRVTEEIQPGHVDIELVDRDGVTLIRTSADLHRIGKLLKRPQRFSFTAEIPVTPPEESIIRINYKVNP